MHSPLIVKAYAKINLFLNLLGTRPDGFHQVRFIMQTISLADRLEITPAGEGLRIDFQCPDANLSAADNLVVQAYHLFYQCSSLPPKAIHALLSKEIPVQAGLGGGSSDAAAMLQALNRLHGDCLEIPQLETMAARLGSDVPFFLHGGTCIATGRGEIITPLKPFLPQEEVVVLKPRDFGISTPEAFRWMRELGHYQTLDFSNWERLIRLSGSNSPFSWEAMLRNDFETVLFPRYPQLEQAKQLLLDLGLTGSLVSGSGPTVFGILSDASMQWPAILEHFSPEKWLVLRARFISDGLKIEE